ncbi:nucleoid-associated protein [Oceanobacter kriegii]|uniref:nucleoid-associated protein n=1 Tax=Oceanobacter kriegii TaxID=64972 RepID=UPI00040F47F6|nr:nucleoid-associated protein [Oceanobacter kriegii]
MNIVNLQVQRIVIHQIHQRDEDGKKVTPSRGTEFIRFDAEAMNTFKSRFINAIGAESKAVPMSIVNQESTDLPPMVDMLSECGDEDFISLSYDVANKLADAQQRKNLQGGIVVVFGGLYGATPKKFVGIMKAEIHSAYGKKVDDLTSEITLKYIEEALLTPATKLYKTAAFFEKSTTPEGDDLNSKWDVLVSDSQISQAEGKAAALYFYSSFLGCGYPETCARTTKQFYDATCEFLNDIDVSEEKRNDLHNALVSYLKHENSDVVNPLEFSSRYFDVETRDSYSEFLEDKEIPNTAFTKDIEFISGKLKTRKLSFSKDVKLIAPSQVFKELVDIQSINVNDAGEAVKWTKIIVKDEIVAQE